MTFTVRLAAYVPPARVDSIPFLRARIEEAAVAAGPWEAIETVTLKPVDPNPLEPIVRDFTTGLATLAEGFYRVVWIDGNLAETAPTPPVQNAAPSGTRPSVAEVAALLRARTKVKGGGEAGTFTPSTRPTSDEVNALIDNALDDVLGKIVDPANFAAAQGNTLAAYERRVRGAVVLYTAVLIETSYFPEQIKTGQSAATVYQGLYDSRLEALIAEGEAGHTQGMGGKANDAPADAAWTFPDASPAGLIGWQSRF